MSTPAVTTLSQSESTAPVLEFRCLYTFNLTQKKKKWQDGMLHFHTRNKRAMVYDTSTNYIGDGHWQSNSDLVEGDEFDLHCGALVQVADMLRTSHTDLTPLLEKKRKHVEDVAARQSSTAPIRISSQRSVIGDESNKKHKSLRSIIASQSATNHRGERYSDNIENEVPNKRAKNTQVPVASSWSITATSKKTASKPKITPGTSPLNKSSKGSSKTTKAKNSKLATNSASQSTFKVKQVIDLTSDSPQEEGSARVESVHSSHADKRSLGVRRRHVPEPSASIAHPPSSPPVNSANLVQNVDSLLNHQAVTVDTRQPESNIRDLHSRAKPLRLSKAKTKGTLLCMQTPAAQELPNQDDDEFQHFPSDSDEALNGRMHERDMFMHNSDTAEPALENQGHLGHNNKKDKTWSRRVPDGSRVLNTNHRRPHHQITPRQRSNIEPNTSQQGDINIPSSLLLPASSPAIQTSPRRSSNSLRRTQSAAFASGLPCGLPHQNGPPTQSALINGPTRRQSPQLRRAYTVNFTNRLPMESLAAASAQVMPLPARNLPSMQLPHKKAGETGPWSVEALDLFDWRPPDWEQRRMDVPGSVGMVD